MNSIPSSHDPEALYLDLKRAAERRYAQALNAVTFMRGGNEVRDAARKAAHDQLTADYQAANEAALAAREQLEHGKRVSEMTDDEVRRLDGGAR